MLKMQGRKETTIYTLIKTPSWKFEGVMLKWHLISKSHKLPKKESEIAESFVNQEIKHLVNKHRIPKPDFGSEYHTSIGRIDVHLIHSHQITCGSKKFQKETTVGNMLKFMIKSFILLLSQVIMIVILIMNPEWCRSGWKQSKNYKEQEIKHVVSSFKNISTSTKIFNLTTKKSKWIIQSPKIFSTFNTLERGQSNYCSF